MLDSSAAWPLEFNPIHHRVDGIEFVLVRDLNPTILGPTQTEMLPGPEFKQSGE